MPQTASYFDEGEHELKIEIINGAVGALLAMKYLRHKTKHWYFWVVNIVGLLLHIVIAVWIVLFLNA